MLSVTPTGSVRRSAIVAKLRLGTERGNGVEQSPAMADQGDVEILQVRGCQARQNQAVDRVFAKGRFVLVEPETPQPIFNIHDGEPPANNLILK